MPIRSDLGAQRRLRLWNSWLWILAAVLGAMTLYLVMYIVHDRSQVRQAAHLVVAVTAHEIMARASQTLQVIGAQTFAPIAPGAAMRPLAGREAVAALVRGQSAALRCKCRETLPADAFFYRDIASGTTEMQPMPGDDSRSGVPTSLLAAIAGAAEQRLRAPRLPLVDLSIDSARGAHAIISVLAYDSARAPVGVYGFVADARTTMRTLFGRETLVASHGDSSVGLVKLDSLSLEVATADGVVLFGRADRTRPLRAIVRQEGRGSPTVTVALLVSQFSIPLLAPATKYQLGHLALLLAATILVLGIAVGSSRREALLARARSDFIAGVSHDLRMPLAQILLASETLAMRRERDEEQRLTLSSSIVREARRLVALVDNVLLFSRSGAVELRARLEPVPVNELLADVAEAAQLAIDDAGHTLEVRHAEPLAVLGDRQLLRQALINLVENAMKYGGDGRHIRLGAEQSAPALVRLMVDDDGPGVPASQRVLVFEPYERLGRDQTSERTGTGLGLAVVRHIAVACKGRVWIEEARGGGTRVVLELASSPLHELAPPAATIA